MWFTNTYEAKDACNTELHLLKSKRKCLYCGNLGFNTPINRNSLWKALSVCFSSLVSFSSLLPYVSVKIGTIGMITDVSSVNTPQSLWIPTKNPHVYQMHLVRHFVLRSRNTPQSACCVVIRLEWWAPLLELRGPTYQFRCCVQK